MPGRTIGDALQSLLADYNLTTTKPMFLAVSQFAVEHLVRVLRVLLMPCGHALLVGVGGSGRKVRGAVPLSAHDLLHFLPSSPPMPCFRAVCDGTLGWMSCLHGVTWCVVQSLTRLAAYIGGLQLTEMNVTMAYSLLDWRSDLKKVCWKAGVDGVPTVLIFSDNQAKMPQFLEDLNNLLNSGEVPTLLSRQEKAEAAEKMRDTVAMDHHRSEDAGRWRLLH